MTFARLLSSTGWLLFLIPLLAVFAVILYVIGRWYALGGAAALVLLIGFASRRQA